MNEIKNCHHQMSNFKATIYLNRFLTVLPKVSRSPVWIKGPYLRKGRGRDLAPLREKSLMRHWVKHKLTCMF